MRNRLRAVGRSVAHIQVSLIGIAVVHIEVELVARQGHVVTYYPRLISHERFGNKLRAALEVCELTKFTAVHGVVGQEVHSAVKFPERRWTGVAVRIDVKYAEGVCFNVELPQLCSAGAVRCGKQHHNARVVEAWHCQQLGTIWHGDWIGTGMGLMGTDDRAVAGPELPTIRFVPANKKEC